MTRRCILTAAPFPPDLGVPGMGLGAFYHRLFCPFGSTLCGLFLVRLGHTWRERRALFLRSSLLREGAPSLRRGPFRHGEPFAHRAERSMLLWLSSPVLLDSPRSPLVATTTPTP